MYVPSKIVFVKITLRMDANFYKVKFFKNWLPGTSTRAELTKFIPATSTRVPGTIPYHCLVPGIEANFVFFGSSSSMLLRHPY